jgi:hypothetical protein
MRLMGKALATLALLWVSSASAGGYLGAVGGLMDVDLGGDSPFNAGIRGGYSWASGWGVEGEYTSSISDGTYDHYWLGETDYSIDTMGVYATYRSPGAVYFKGRLGVINEEVLGVDDTGTSAGLGIGFKAGESVQLEAEYTLIEQDVNFFSGSLVFRF